MTWSMHSTKREDVEGFEGCDVESEKKKEKKEERKEKQIANLWLSQSV